MPILIVVSNSKDWNVNIPGVQVVSSKTYLTEAEYIKSRNTRVFNLCRSYKYQSYGYYVSLLAAARGQKAVPSIGTIEDMKSSAVVRIVSDELEELIQNTLSSLQSDKFTLSIYFGRNISKKYDKLSLQLFNLFQAPLLRAQFLNSGGKWQLSSIGPISASEIPDDHDAYVKEFAISYFTEKRFNFPKRDISGYDLAILVNPNEENPPSGNKAIQKFIKAAEQVGLNAEIITKDDYSRLAEFDALFIRETTRVNHHTFRFAQRAAAEGLYVIDDPESIIKCSNKVYLAELLNTHQILAPKTLIIHKDNINQVKEEIGFPCILKQPDSSFSLGVSKAENEEKYLLKVQDLLDKSDLVVVQEFLPTQFDWRIGIYDKEPLFACKYFMAKEHWQIYNWQKKEGVNYGKFECVPIELLPKGLVKTALQITSIIGDGLYGVDIKQVENKFYVIEVNDNPNIDVGVEDSLSKDKLYLNIMNTFLKKIQLIKESKNRK
jgi:glutathione synthase/RimK-type ligase-like ATP-grasp enzyme